MEDDFFDCTFQSWNGVHKDAEALAEAVRADGYDVDIVVGLARGGWAPARCVCDFLGVSDATSLKVEHYVGAGKTDNEATLCYGLEPEMVEGKNVLVVDDIVDTGKTLQTTVEAFETQYDGFNDIRVGTMQTVPGSEDEVDYYGRSLAEWKWIIYPWAVVEDITELLEELIESGHIDSTASRNEMRAALKKYYNLTEEDFDNMYPSFEKALVHRNANIG